LGHVAERRIGTNTSYTNQGSSPDQDFGADSAAYADDESEKRYYRCP
jgi:hypothetical protein